MLNDETIELFAIRAAKGNNGGEWATHYNEDQKNYWRMFVRDMEASIAAARDISAVNRRINNGMADAPSGFTTAPPGYLGVD